MRIFTAIALPQTIKDSLKPLLGADIPSSRWVHPDDLHITLRFIGEVTEDELERYKRILATLSVTPFEITLRGLGRFPEKTQRPARVLWVGVELNPALMTLQETVQNALEAGELPPDKINKYTPHVTLARLNVHEDDPAFANYMQEHSSLTLPPMPVNAITLYSSVTQPNGAHYTPLATYR